MAEKHTLGDFDLPTDKPAQHRDRDEVRASGDETQEGVDRRFSLPISKPIAENNEAQWPRFGLGHGLSTFYHSRPHTLEGSARRRYSDPDSLPRSSNIESHKCPHCEAEFTRQHNLTSHLLTHSQEKAFVCDSCLMRFRRLDGLKRHSKLHTGERPHICPKCNRCFARRDDFARHAKSQGGCAGRNFSRDEEYDEGDETKIRDESGMDGHIFNMFAEEDDQRGASSVGRDSAIAMGSSMFMRGDEEYDDSDIEEIGGRAGVSGMFTEGGQGDNEKIAPGRHPYSISSLPGKRVSDSLTSTHRPTASTQPCPDALPSAASGFGEIIFTTTDYRGHTIPLAPPSQKTSFAADVPDIEMMDADVSPVFDSLTQRDDHLSPPVIRPPLCSTCNIVCRTNTQLKKHEARHNKRFKCEHDACDRSKDGFATQNDLQRHILSKHRDDIQGAQNITLYVCKKDDCENRQFPRLDNFRAHLLKKHNLSRMEASLIASALKAGSCLSGLEAESFALVSSKDKAAREPPHSVGSSPSSPKAEEEAGQPMRDDKDNSDIDMIEAGLFPSVTKKRPSDEDPVSSSPDKRPRISSEFPARMSSSPGMQGNDQQRGPYDSLDILERQTYGVSPPALPVIQSSVQEDFCLPSLRDVLEPTSISSAHNSLQSPSSHPPVQRPEPSPDTLDDHPYSDTPSERTSHGTRHIRQRRARRNSPTFMADESDGAESAPLLRRHGSPTLSSTSSADWSHRSAGLYGGTSPQDAGSPSSTGSSGNQSGAASTNTANTSVSAWSGQGPNNVAGQSQGQIPSPNGTGNNQPAAGGSGDPSPGGFAILIGFLKADPALMMLFDLMLLAGFGCQVGACVSYFKDEYQRGDGHPTDPDFLSLFAGFWLQMAGLYIIVFGIFKFADRYLRWWLISMTVLSLLLSGSGLGFYFLYTTVGDTLMWFGGLAQIWTFKMIAFHRKRDDYIPRGSPAPPIGSPIPLTGVQSRGPCHCK